MNFIKKINPKNRIYILGGSIIAFFIFVIGIASIFTNSKVTYEDVEQKMKNAAQIYYKNRTEKLPEQDGNTVTITAEELVESGNLKSLDKYIKDATCTGYVKVMNNNSFYLYLPYLDCGESYKSTTLYSKIVSPSKIVTSGNGLYQSDDEFIFRGEYVDNYVTFANQSWRIIKVNSDHSLRLIHIPNEEKAVKWDNRYNIETDNSDGINNYLVSRIRDRVVNRYNDKKFFTDTNRSYIISHNVCIGKRIAKDENSVECSQILKQQPLSLLRVSEFMNASIDPNCIKITENSCMNYNWMAKLSSFWTITGHSLESNYVYRINGTASKTKTNTQYGLNVVLHLSGDILYKSGDGTSKNPYVIK